MEAVVSDDSPLVGRTPAQEKLDERYGVHVLAVSRRGARITAAHARGAVRGGRRHRAARQPVELPETLGELRCLPLAARDLRLGRGGRSVLPLSILVLAMAFVAANVDSGRDRVLRRGGRDAADPRADLARSLRGGRLADPGDARRADPGVEVAAHHRRHRPDRGLAVVGGAEPAAARRARADHGGGDGGDAVPQQCRDRAGDGADRGELCQDARLQPRRRS